MHIEVFTEGMLVKRRVVHMDHAGLRKRRQHLVGALRGVVCAAFQSCGPKGRVKARVPKPGLINDDLDALGMRLGNDGFKVIAQAIVGARGQHHGFGVRVVFHRLKQRGLGHRAKQAKLGVDGAVQIHRQRA